jgi:hypothetical protein
MHPRTIATLQELEEAHWFSRVGIQQDSTTAIVVGSWPEAIEHCRSPEWEDLCLEAKNQYCERIAERSPERWSHWNEIAAEVRAIAIPFVERKIESTVRDNDLPEIFGVQVCADVLMLCMEAEYADIVAPGFFAANAYWYVNGHFPCGWSGGFPPMGRLVIY